MEAFAFDAWALRARMTELAQGDVVEDAVEAAHRLGYVARVTDGCRMGRTGGAGPGGIDIGGKRHDFDTGPERLKARDRVRRDGDDNDASGLQGFEGSGRQAMLRLGVLPADSKAAVSFNVAEHTPRHADVLAVMLAIARLQTCREFKAGVAGIAAPGRGDQEIFAARRSPGEQDQQAARFCL